MEYGFLFDQEEINSTEKVEGKVFSLRQEKKKIMLLDIFKVLNELFPEKIEKNESIHLISSDNFGSIELLKVLTTRIKPEKISITTWSYNDEFVNVIESLLKSGVEIDFFVDKSIKTRKSHLYAQMVILRDSYKNIKIKIHHMLHAKLTTIKAGNLFLTVESSANYSGNQRIENYVITESEELFNFHNSWMNQLIGK